MEGIIQEGRRLRKSFLVQQGWGVLQKDFRSLDYDDESLGCGVEGPCVGFGGEMVTGCKIQKVPELNSGTSIFRFRLSLARVHLHTFR